MHNKSQLGEVVVAPTDMRIFESKKGRVHLVAGDSDYTLCGLKRSKFMYEQQSGSEIQATPFEVAATESLCKHCERIRKQEE